MEIFMHSTNILVAAKQHIDGIKSYTGCGEFIRKAISSPGPQSEREAWNALTPAVLKLKDFYEFSVSLQGIFPGLLRFLAQGNTLENMAKHQATVKNLTTIIYFASQFDEAKMINSNLQNDFSFYRRSLAKMRVNNGAGIPINDELANQMSLFYAQAGPMMKALVDSLAQTADKAPYLRCLALVISICYNVIDKKIANDLETVDFCLRVMTMSIIIYDHISPQGAFEKAVGLNIRSCVKLIKYHAGNSAGPLMNSLKYATVHLNDATTPNSIKQLINQST